MNMQYRKFGKLDWNASVLGFGCMRLPTADGKPHGANIDETEAVRMIHHALDQGVNYFDTAYTYHEGSSEIVLHYKLLEKVETAMQDGRIRHLGFSFHDDCETFANILNGYDRWTFCQIQYNYLDKENQAGTPGLKLAAAKGLAVVIMEPLLGGRLAQPPQSVRQIIERSSVKRSPADWALQWLWDQPEVSVVLSGMSNVDQVRANLNSAAHARVHSFQAVDLNLIVALQQEYRKRSAIPCTKCSYCSPCPNGVNIPANFDIYNEIFLHEDIRGARLKYQIVIPESARAGVCLAGHTCEDHCPQKIQVSDWMPRIHELLKAE